ncbi:hypothetical protein BKI52_24925 [marine bacterium AO1-C]|nr:hypothetical protein BKI52_24925 [marine bacterium AO1-C]
MNHYQRLGVTKESTLEEVEQAYHSRLQEYKTQAEQGVIIDKEAETALEKSYQVITNYILDAQRKKIPQGIKFLLMVIAGAVIVLSPILLVDVFDNPAFFVLIPVFFVLLILLNIVINTRRLRKNNGGKLYRPNTTENRKKSRQSIIWIVSILAGVYFLGYTLGEETIDNTSDYVELAIGILAACGGLFMLVKDWLIYRKNNN